MEYLEFQNVDHIVLIVRFFNKIISEGTRIITMIQTVKCLNLNTCPVNEEEQNSGAYLDIKDFTLHFKSMTNLHMKGLRIADKLGEVIAACRRPEIKELNLEYNGIEPDFCLYFQHIINYETLEHLNISHNWIGMQGIEHMINHFKRFKNLKVLNLSSNKLFMMSDRRTENFRDMLLDVAGTLEDLNLSENSMEKEDFEIITRALIQMPNLKNLNLNVNRIWGPSLRQFLDQYIANQDINQLSLEELLLK